jgi:hypothetical protein
MIVLIFQILCMIISFAHSWLTLTLIVLNLVTQHRPRLQSLHKIPPNMYCNFSSCSSFSHRPSSISSSFGDTSGLASACMVDAIGISTLFGLGWAGNLLVLRLPSESGRSLRLSVGIDSCYPCTPSSTHRVVALISFTGFGNDRLVIVLRTPAVDISQKAQGDAPSRPSAVLQYEDTVLNNEIGLKSETSPLPHLYSKKSLIRICSSISQ